MPTNTARTARGLGVGGIDFSPLLQGPSRVLRRRMLLILVAARAARRLATLFIASWWALVLVVSYYSWCCKGRSAFGNKFVCFFMHAKNLGVVACVRSCLWPARIARRLALVILRLGAHQHCNDRSKSRIGLSLQVSLSVLQPYLLVRFAHPYCTDRLESCLRWYRFVLVAAGTAPCDRDGFVCYI